MAETFEERLERLLQQAVDRQAKEREAAQRPAPVKAEVVPAAAPENVFRPLVPHVGGPPAPLKDTVAPVPREPLPAASSQANVAAAQPTLAQETLQLLRQPGGARRAFLLAEIFRRPEF